MRKPRSLDDGSKTEVGYAPKPSGYLLHRMAELGLRDGSTIPRAMPACWRRTAQGVLRA